jgi:hypothetical protein
VRLAKALVALTALTVVAVTVPSSAQSRGPFVAGEILVKFRPGANANTRSTLTETDGPLLPRRLR